MTINLRNQVLMNIAANILTLPRLPFMAWAEARTFQHPMRSVRWKVRTTIFLLCPPVNAWLLARDCWRQVFPKEIKQTDAACIDVVLSVLEDRE